MPSVFIEKDWWKSKTLWFGVAWAVFAVVNGVLNFFGYGEFQPSADLVTIVALINAVIIILLRKKTNTAIR